MRKNHGKSSGWKPYRDCLLSPCVFALIAPHIAPKIPGCRYQPPRPFVLRSGFYGGFLPFKTCRHKKCAPRRQDGARIFPVLNGEPYPMSQGGSALFRDLHHRRHGLSPRNEGIHQRAGCVKALGAFVCRQGVECLGVFYIQAIRSRRNFLNQQQG